LAFCASQDPRKVPKPAMICYNTFRHAEEPPARKFGDVTR
jgi:hypothetical protein